MNDTIYVHFVVNGVPATTKTHGVVKIITDKNPAMLPCDWDATEDNPATPVVEGDGAELVYQVGKTEIINGIVEASNEKGLTLGDLVMKQVPDADDKGQDFDADA